MALTKNTKYYSSPQAKKKTVTVEPLYKDTPEMSTSPIIRTPSMAPATLKVYKTNPEMRTPPLIRTL
jgi:hypothetical protein